jgi:hypothetical protein
LTRCRALVDAVSPRDGGGGHGGPGRRPGLPGAEAPRGLEGARPAPHGARAPKSPRPWSRGTPPRQGQAAEHGEPRGGPGGLARRRRGRGDGVAGHAERAGLVLRLPASSEHDGDGGGGALAPRYFRGVAPAWEREGVNSGGGYSRGVWAPHGAMGLGQGGSRAPGYGAHSSASRGGVALRAKARPHRDLFRSPEKPRVA